MILLKTWQSPSCYSAYFLSAHAANSFSSEFWHHVTISKFSFLAIFITNTSPPPPPVQKLLTFTSWQEVPGAGGGLRLVRSSCWVFALRTWGYSWQLVLWPWRNHVACTLQLVSSLVSTSLSDALTPDPTCSSAGCGQTHHVAVAGMHASLTCFLFFSHQEGAFMEYLFLVVPVGRRNNA